jgi:hypothetical protein
MRLRAVLRLLLLIALAGVPGWSIEPQPLPGGPTSWDGPQFIQADRTGNVYVLRSKTFEVYPLEKSGVLGKPVALEPTGVPAGFVREATMSPSGDRWLLLSGMSVRYFVDGKEKALPPLEWKPWSLTLLRDTPIVAAAPFPLGDHSGDPKKAGTPPWLLQFDGDRWSSILDLKGVSVADLLENNGLNDAIAKNSVVLKGDRQGRLWAARQYGYRVQRFTPGGRLLLEIVVGGGKIREKGDGRAIDIKLSREGQNPREATQDPRREKGTYLPFTAQRVVYGLTEGRDGNIYLLVDAGEGAAALDRFDPTRAIVERVPLTFKLKDMVTLAAGRDALYLAPWSAEKGRWRISWDVLEAAAWKPVKDARIDGYEPESGKAKASSPR